MVRISSFVNAFSGLVWLIKNERNFQIHVIAVFVTTIAGFYFKISHFEWLIMCCFYAIVISLEAINTAIEQLCNLVQPEHDIRIKTIKDIAAAAVFLGAVIAIVVGIIIFLPKLG
jgi:diacylglycerol kinase